MTKVSVALPAYNGARYIQAAIESLLDQDGLDEIVVSDDRSTDDTVAIVRRFKHPKLRLLLNSDNVGQGANFNRAIRACQGELVQLFSQDDIAHPDFIKAQIAAMERSDGVGLAYSSCLLIDERDDQFGASDDDGTPLLIDFETYLQISSRHGALPPSISSVMIRRGVIDEAGPFDGRLVATVDVEFFNRVAEKFLLSRNRSLLLDVRSHKGSVSSNPETQKRFMIEEIALLEFYRRHMGNEAFRDVIRFRARHRGADHAKYILRSIVSGRLSDAKIAYSALAQVHSVPICLLHALLQRMIGS
jgi:glycosyltransferase involved in cell wall biosynthesis